MFPLWLLIIITIRTCMVSSFSRRQFNHQEIYGSHCL